MRGYRLFSLACIIPNPVSGKDDERLNAQVPSIVSSEQNDHYTNASGLTGRWPVLRLCRWSCDPGKGIPVLADS